MGIILAAAHRGRAPADGRRRAAVGRALGAHRHRARHAVRRLAHREDDGLEDHPAPAGRRVVRRDRRRRRRCSSRRRPASRCRRPTRSPARSSGSAPSRRLSAVRWGVAGRVVWAWVLTIPGRCADRRGDLRHRVGGLMDRRAVFFLVAGGCLRSTRSRDGEVDSLDPYPSRWRRRTWCSLRSSRPRLTGRADSNTRTDSGALGSPEPAGDVSLGSRIGGFVKICSVPSNSTSRPTRLPSSSTSAVKNAVLSEIRVACWMLWVTITIVKSLFRPADEILDARRCDWIKGGAGLVHQHPRRVPRRGSGLCRAAAVGRLRA